VPSSRCASGRATPGAPPASRGDDGAVAAQRRHPDGRPRRAAAGGGRRRYRCGQVDDGEHPGRDPRRGGVRRATDHARTGAGLRAPRTRPPSPATGCWPVCPGSSARTTRRGPGRGWCCGPATRCRRVWRSSTPPTWTRSRPQPPAAEDVLADADVWLWFVTARTYADEAGARYLRIARDRGVALGVVVTQVTRLLDARNGSTVDLLTSVPVATVDRRPGPHHGGRRAASVRARSRHPGGPRTRRADVRSTASVPPSRSSSTRWRVRSPRRAARGGPVGGQAGLDLRRTPGSRSDLEAELEHGIPLRADVLARWRDLVGGSDTLVRLQTVAQRMRGAVQ
jgi:hypothetical protein